MSAAAEMSATASNKRFLGFLMLGLDAKFNLLGNGNGRKKESSE